MPKNILLVDDEHAGFGELAQALDAAGYTPLVTRPGDSAPGIFGEAPADLVFISLEAPTALADCEGIRANPDGAIVPIVFIGHGHPEVGSPSQALAKGADFFFDRPYDMKKVLNKVQTYVGRGTPQGASAASSAAAPASAAAPVVTRAPVPSPPSATSEAVGLAASKRAASNAALAALDSELSSSVPSRASVVATTALSGLPPPPSIDMAPADLAQPADALLKIIEEREAQAREAAEAQAREAAEAQAREAAEAQAREAAEAQAREAAEAQAREAAEAQAREAAEAQAREAAEAEAREAAEAQAREAAEAQAREAAEAEARAAAEAQAREAAEAQAREAAEAEARAAAEAEAREAAEAEARAAAEAEAREAAEAQAREAAEADARAAAEAEAREAAEAQAREAAEAEARQAIEDEARQAAKDAARQAAEDDLRRKVEEQARRKADEQVRRAAAEQGRLQAEERLRLEVEAQAALEAEEQARLEPPERQRPAPVAASSFRTGAAPSASRAGPQGAVSAARLGPLGAPSASRAGPVAPLPRAVLGRLPTPAASLEPDEGQLDAAFDVATVVAVAYAQQVTGRIDFASQGRQKTLFFDRGDVVDAYSSQVFDRVEEYLLREGKVTRVQYQQVRVKSLRGARKVGAFLVGEGFLKPEELFDVVRGHLSDVIYGLFEWEEGTFRFSPDRASDDDRVVLDIDMRRLVAEGIRRKYLQARLAARLGGPSSLIGLLPDIEVDGALLGFNAAELRVARLLDGSHSLDDMVFSTGLEVTRVYQIVATLVALGMATVLVHGLGAESGRGSENADHIDRSRILDKLEQVRDADYFQMLGVPRTATAYELERALEHSEQEFNSGRFSLALQQELAAELEEIGQIIREASSVLRDETLRASYARRLPG